MLGASPRIAVLGGGIAGLVAALRCAQGIPGARIELFEQGAKLGGKLHTVELGSHPFDVGAEAFVVRRPEARALVRELGLSDAEREPAGASPALYVDGDLHSLPKQQVFGIPGDPNELGGLLPDSVIAAIAAETERPAAWMPGGDANVGDLVAAQYGREAVDRLVDPLLGGVYAAPARRLGLRTVAPGLAAVLDCAAAETGRASLVEAVRQIKSTAVSGQVFGTLEGGYAALVDALARADRDSGVTIRLRTPVGAVSPPTGPRSADRAARILSPEGEPLAEVDAVVSALPFHAVSSVLAPLDAESGNGSGLGERFGSLDYSSSAVVALELEPGTEVPELSGVLVAADAGRAAKAITLSSRKWSHLDRTAAGEGHVLRVSFGRLGDTAALDLGDAELAALATSEIGEIAGIEPRVAHSRVARWRGGLPVPGPRHGGYISGLTADCLDLPVPVALAGAAVLGVGVPACIASAEAAARSFGAQWQDGPHGTPGL
ncbi:FAD-dependent oxidoreductase [Dietzia sp.]|uniref:FAD-dependent oxidoreductase n=1 Tax=Dietzia sp. TaxID=1871616 RepID=UPI002FDA79D3